MSSPVYLATAATRGQKLSLQDAQSAAGPSYVGPGFAKKITSDGASETHVWRGQAPLMKLMTDLIEAAGLTDTTYNLDNETHGIGMAVKREHMKDDQLGLHMSAIRDMADIAVDYPNKLTVDSIVAGTTELCYDGAEFYDGTHPSRGNPGSGAQDNLAAGTGVSTSALLKTDTITNIATMTNFLGENGQPLRAVRNKFLALVPPAIVGLYNEAIHSALQSSTSNQAFRGMTIDIVSDARLSDADDWYLNDATPGAEPLLYQTRQGVEPEMLGPGSDYYVRQRKWWFQFTWRGKMGYRHFGNSIKIVN